jgi:predicted pyridoxine 5'-phosphate oxidase superfamily flavin-nucleotide-binding protein
MDTGFHSGELAVQRQAGVRHEAARLSRMLEPVELSGGIKRFLADRSFLVVTGRDGDGRLWTSPLFGRPGFLDVWSVTELAVHAGFPAGDPLHGIAAGQKVGMTAVEFAARRRVRINGTLTAVGEGLLVVDVEQAFGNCPQHIHPRVLSSGGISSVRRGATLEADDIELIRAADTFFLGTINPDRGADASHRGGPAGFVQVDRGGLSWPDFPGNNMFNSLGNLAVDPEAALLFIDFATGSTLHLSGTARVDWSATDRIVRFSVDRFIRLSGVEGTSTVVSPARGVLGGEGTE